MAILPPPEPPKSEGDKWRDWFVAVVFPWLRPVKITLILLMGAWISFLGVKEIEMLTTAEKPTLNFNNAPLEAEVDQQAQAVTFSWPKPDPVNGTFVDYRVIMRCVQSGFSVALGSTKNWPRVNVESTTDTESYTLDYSVLPKGSVWTVSIDYRLKAANNAVIPKRLTLLESWRVP